MLIRIFKLFEMKIENNINVIYCNYNNPALITPIIVYYLTPTSCLSFFTYMKTPNSLWQITNIFYLVSKLQHNFSKVEILKLFIIPHYKKIAFVENKSYLKWIIIFYSLCIYCCWISHASILSWPFSSCIYSWFEKIWNRSITPIYLKVQRGSEYWTPEYQKDLNTLILLGQSSDAVAIWKKDR